MLYRVGHGDLMEVFCLDDLNIKEDSAPIVLMYGRLKGTFQSLVNTLIETLYADQQKSDSEHRK